MFTDDNDPRSNFLSSLELSKCRVEFSPRPIVLLCGGKVDEKNHVSDRTPPIASLRHAIANTSIFSKFEFFRPEEIQDWQSDAIFKDLVSFELELASICSLVVIILESEGSLVELGAFSQQVELNDKIIAVCSTKFKDDHSFINFGILRFLKQKNPSYVRSYPWEIDKPKTISQDVVKDILFDIQQELDKLHKTQVFKINRNTHIIVLICELLRFFHALKESELLEYLSYLGAKIDKHLLKRKLFLLKKFNIIKVNEYSDTEFYMKGSESYHSIRISLKDKAKIFDISRLQMECSIFYKNNEKHRNRNKVIFQTETRLP